MKQFYLVWLALTTLFFTFSPAKIYAQSCKMAINAVKTELCQNQSTQIFVNVGDTTSTTFIDNNSQRGNMFTIVAKNNIIVTNFDAHPESDTKYAIYYKKGAYKGYERDSTAWTLLGRHFNVKSNGNGYATPIPIHFAVKIAKGDSASFYVSSTITSVAQNYTNGKFEHRIYAQDANMFIREGAGLDWPFTHASITGIFAPRIWNGNVYYQLDEKKSVKWNTNETTDTITISPTKTTNYTVDVTMGSCKMRSSIEIQVENLKVNLGPDTTLCSGNSIQLDAGASPKGTKYDWKPGGIGSRYKLFSAGGEKSVIVTSPLGCKYRDTIFIQDKKSPVVDLGNDIDLCEGDSVDLDAGNFGSLAVYNWNTSATTQSINVKQTGRYVLSVTDSFGCEAKDNIDVTVRNNPSIDLGKDKEVCEGDDVVLDAKFSDNNTTYTWNTFENTKIIKIEKTGTYSVLVTSEYGCKGTDDVYYLFHNMPKSPMNDLVEGCKGSSIELDAGNHGPGSSYNWSTNATTRNINVSTDGQYLVSITDSFGCIGIDTINALFRKLPKVDLGDDISFCDGKSVTLDAVFDDGYSTYNWSTNETTKSIMINTTGTYSVLVTDSFGCEKSDEIDITVLNNPIITFGPDTAICKGSSIELNPGTHKTYLWSNNATTATITVGAGTYGVTVTNNDGCEASDEIEVGTIADAEANFTANDIGGQEISITNTSTNASSYLWEFGDGETSTDENPVHWYKKEGAYTVKLTATNECSESNHSQTVQIAASGINKDQNQYFALYPNPAHSELFLGFTGTNPIELSVRVFSMNGQEIAVRIITIYEHNLKIDLPNNMANGLYNLVINAQNEMITKSFIIE